MLNILSTVNSASMKTRVHIFFGNNVFSVNMSMGSLLHHMIIPFIVFKGTALLFTIVALPVYMPTNSARGFLFLQTLFRNYCL